jgi:hypothetical protein
MLSDGLILKSEACLVASRVTPQTEASKRAMKLIRERIAVT